MREEVDSLLDQSNRKGDLRG